MLIQKNHGRGKAMCLLQNNPKSGTRNNHKLVLPTLDGFLTPEQAGPLKNWKVKRQDVYNAKTTTKINPRAVVSRERDRRITSENEMFKNRQRKFKEKIGRIEITN